MARKGSVRAVPQDLDSERATLGAMLLDGSAVDVVRALGVLPEHFYTLGHQAIARVVYALRDESEAVDLTTVGAELERGGELEKAGDRTYLAGLLDAVPTAAHAESYARNVAKAAAQRGLIRVGLQLAELGRNPESAGEVRELRAGLQRDLEKLAQLEVAASSPVRVLDTFTGAELWQREVPETRWVVEGLLAEGLSVCAGAPKLGKSWLALQLAVSVASGAQVLGHYPSRQCEVLYVAAEDGEARLKKRLLHLEEVDAGFDSRSLGALRFRLEWPKLNPEGMEALRGFLLAHPQVGLVIFDTWQKVRPASRGRQDAYAEDYDALSPLQRLALDRHVSVLLIHHTRKAQATDIFEEVSGSHGVTGSADMTMVIKRPRRERLGSLEMTGRDVGEDKVALSFDGGFWCYAGDADELKVTSDRREILDVVGEKNGEPVTPSVVAAALGKSRSNVAHIMARMRDEGLLVNLMGAGYVCVSQAEAVPASLRERDHSHGEREEREKRERENSDHSDHSVHHDHSDHSDHSVSSGPENTLPAQSDQSDLSLSGLITLPEGLEGAPPLGSGAQSDQSDQSDHTLQGGDLGAYSSET